MFISADKRVKCRAAVLTCCGHPYQFSGMSSVSPAGPQQTECPLEGHKVKNQLFSFFQFVYNLLYIINFLTQEDSTLFVVNKYHTILELGGQVEGEARSWQTRLRWWDLLQHVAHDVIAVWALALL